MHNTVLFSIFASRMSLEKAVCCMHVLFASRLLNKTHTRMISFDICFTIFPFSIRTTDRSIRDYLESDEENRERTTMKKRETTKQKKKKSDEKLHFSKVSFGIENSLKPIERETYALGCRFLLFFDSFFLSVENCTSSKQKRKQKTVKKNYVYGKKRIQLMLLLDKDNDRMLWLFPFFSAFLSSHFISTLLAVLWAQKWNTHAVLSNIVCVCVFSLLLQENI